MRHRSTNQVKTRLRFSSASSPSCPGTAAVCDSAFARGHGSGLLTLRLHSIHSSAVSFVRHRRALERFSRVLPGPRVLPGASAHFVAPFSVFRLADSISGNARVVRPVLIHSSNRLPSGNCDSLEFETSSSYLTEFGTVSHRSSSLSPFFAFTDGARTPPEELVNSASAFGPCDPLKEELSQPA